MKDKIRCEFCGCHNNGLLMFEDVLLCTECFTDFDEMSKVDKPITIKLKTYKMGFFSRAMLSNNSIIAGGKQLFQVTSVKNYPLEDKWLNENQIKSLQKIENINIDIVN